MTPAIESVASSRAIGLANATVREAEKREGGRGGKDGVVGGGNSEGKSLFVASPYRDQNPEIP